MVSLHLLQGYELEALRGMIKQLKHVDYIYTEINTSDVYKNCAHVADLDQFLGGFRFRRVTTKETEEGWGDTLYSRKIKHYLRQSSIISNLLIAFGTTTIYSLPLCK